MFNGVGGTRPLGCRNKLKSGGFLLVKALQIAKSFCSLIFFSAIVIPHNDARGRYYNGTSACIDNLRQIDGAK